jgi:hypothetical protein
VCCDLKLLVWWRRRRIETRWFNRMGRDQQRTFFLRKTPLCVSVTGKQRYREWLYSENKNKNKRSSDQLLLSP